MKRDVERYQLALSMRRAGHRLREIGDRLGVSAARARGMVIEAERMETQARDNPAREEALRHMDVRAWNLLVAFCDGGDVSPVLIRQALHSGTLSRLPNLGPVSERQIAAWLEHTLRCQCACATRPQT